MSHQLKDSTHMHVGATLSSDEDLSIVDGHSFLSDKN